MPPPPRNSRMNPRSPLDELVDLAELAAERSPGWSAASVWQERVKTRAPVATVSPTEVARARTGWDPLTAWRQRVLRNKS